MGTDESQGRVETLSTLNEQMTRPGGSPRLKAARGWHGSETKWFLKQIEDAYEGCGWAYPQRFSTKEWTGCLAHMINTKLTDVRTEVILYTGSCATYMFCPQSISAEWGDYSMALCTKPK
mmetsp:Transcript_55307/g.103736  ORF Transcript_55307/g.103736 Transcript_55307/m.103736 type:complete len:120 (+) Transcript_55307:151-510(+)